MLVADLLKIGCELLKLLSRYDVKIEDYRFVDLYFDYERRRRNREKYLATVTELAERYGISASTVERLIRRLGKPVKS